MKKIISCLILCAMLLSVFPISAFAGSETDNSNEVSMTTLYNPDAETHTLDLSSYIGGTHVFTISSDDEMVYFNVLISNGAAKNFEGFTVKLKSDIDLSNKTWKKNSYFAGTFDGEGHIISGLTMVDGRGLFGYAVGTISNFALIGASITNNAGNTGAIVGDSNNSVIKGMDLTISNVHVVNSTISGTAQVGGIMGGTNDGDNAAANNVEISNCSFSGVVCGTDKRVGGILGYGVNTTSLTISNCSVSLENSVVASTSTGSIVGETKVPTTLENCVVTPSNYNPSNFVNENGVTVDTSTCFTKESDARYYGFQSKTESGLVDYRVIGALDSDNLSAVSDVGFYVTLTYNGVSKAQKVSCKSVYSSVVGGGITYTTDNNATASATVEKVDGDYLFAIVISDVPTGVEVSADFTAYKTDSNGTVSCGATQSITLSETKN